MFAKKLVVAIVCVVALTAWTGTASADVIVNGGFERGIFDGADWRALPFGGNSAVSITSTPADVYEGTYAAVITNAGAPSTDGLVLDNWETMPAAGIAPGSYHVSFAAKKLSGDASSNITINFTTFSTDGLYTVGARAVPADTIITPGSSYTTYGYDITVADTFPQMLYAEFLMPSGGPAGSYAIDAVSVRTVPEPSALTLVVLGLLSLLAYAWKKR